VLRDILIEGEFDAMDFYLQRLQDAISSATEGMTADLLSRRPQADKWSVAEILEHLYLTYTGTISGFEKCLSAGKPLGRIATMQDRMRTLVVVGLENMPKGRKAPKMTIPRGLPPERVLAEVQEKINAMDAIISEAEQRFGGDCRVLDHPILGPLRACQWRKLHWVHGRHHLKQLWQLRREAASYGLRASRLEL
jgi:hypothetical protein